MKDYNIISGLECCLIAFKNESIYEVPVMLDTTRSAIVVTNRDTEYVQATQGLQRLKNKIIDIDLELEVFNIPNSVLARLEGAILDENGGYLVTNNSTKPMCAIGIVNTCQDNSREFTYYYNCNIEINSIDIETKNQSGISPKAYKVTIKCLGENRNFKYTVREKDLPSESNFIKEFYKNVYKIG